MITRRAFHYTEPAGNPGASHGIVQVNTKSDGSASDYVGAEGDYWNNTNNRSDFTTIGYQIEDALDINEVATGINIYIVNGSSFNGDRNDAAGTGSVIVPQAVMNSKLQTPGTGAAGIYCIEGLSVDSTYAIKETSSYISGGSSRAVAYRVYNGRGDGDDYDTTVTIEVRPGGTAENTSTWAEHSPEGGIKPSDAGELFLSVAQGAGGNSGWISCFTIEMITGGGGAVNNVFPYTLPFNLA